MRNCNATSVLTVRDVFSMIYREMFKNLPETRVPIHRHSVYLRLSNLAVCHPKSPSEGAESSLSILLRAIVRRCVESIREVGSTQVVLKVDRTQIFTQMTTEQFPLRSWAFPGNSILVGHVQKFRDDWTARHRCKIRFRKTRQHTTSTRATPKRKRATWICLLEFG